MDIVDPRPPLCSDGAMKSRLPLALLLLSAPAMAREPLTTLAERTGFAHTGRYDEVQALCPAFARAFPGKAACLELGRTPEGRPMLALAASADGVLTAAAAREKGRAVVLLIGGIHAGEIDGKDAGFQILRELLESPKPNGLSAVTVLFVPVFNVDGHERFGPQQRPNQRGPQEMGYRRTAQELNLNRDWTKAEAPEMAAMLALVTAWDPALMVDLHVTDGAKFEHDVAVLISPEVEPRPLVAAARTLRTTLFARLRAQGHLPLDFYPSFRDEDDPASGVDVSPLSPRFSNGYFGARNRLGMLVETHSWRPYAYRVRTTRVILEALLEAAVTQAAGWRAAGQAADAEGEKLGGTEVPLLYKAGPVPRTVDFRGYAYRREPSAISGVPWIEYDERRPQLWHIPLYDKIEPSLVARAPRAGYVVPAAHAAWVAAKLDLHGIRYQRLARAIPRAATLAFRADGVSFAATPVEGRQPVKLTGHWRPERRDIPAGALFVPIAQPRARLAMHLLEPAASDSLAAWGFFQTAFEEKEGMEAYVAEAEARRMLARDARLRAEFEASLRDPAFARDPVRRLDFFRRRHPSWNEGFNLYPVLQLDQLP
jgi:hypothetical protein